MLPKKKIVKYIFLGTILATFFSIPILHAKTIMWQPQVADLRITNFEDFGEVADRKSQSLTVTCIESSGSAQITFTKEPSDLPISINPPAAGTPSLTEGESYTLTFEVVNLGASTTRSFSITTEVSNTLGTVTDTATAYGTLMEKTGATEETPETTDDSETQSQPNGDQTQLYIIIILIAIVALLVGVIIGSRKKTKRKNMPRYFLNP